jgi:LmbE family N-acetylglucosaminyl deacetylase
MKVLVVAAHPDDEVLGCGATMARHAAEGDEVHVLICAQGLASRGDVSDAEIAALRDAAARAAQALRTHPPRFLGYPDNAMDTVPLLEVVQHVEAVVGELQPDLVYTHHPGDLNVDHQLVTRATVTACRPLPGSGVRGLFGFEVLSSTEWSVPGLAEPFVPSHFVDVTATLERKLEALGCYASEMREFPYPRSIEAVRHLAALRGAASGFARAEAFVPLRTRRPA